MSHIWVWTRDGPYGPPLGRWTVNAVPRIGEEIAIKRGNTLITFTVTGVRHIFDREMIEITTDAESSYGREEHAESPES